MKNISTTYISTAVAFLVFALPVIGIEVTDKGTLTGIITNIVGIIAILYTFYGRFRAGGINAFGLRK